MTNDFAHESKFAKRYIGIRIFLVDLLNFSFWSDLDRDDTGNCPDRFTVSFNNQLYTGYWSLCAAINRGKLYKNVFIYALKSQ